MFQYQPRLDPANRKRYAAFVAGRGIEPVLPAVKAILDKEPQSKVLLFYGNREAGQVPSIEELQALKDRYLSRVALHFFFSREAQEVEIFNGRLDAAKLAQLAGQLFVPTEIDEYILCGPGDMNQKLAAGLKSLSVDPLRIHSEHFAPEAAAPAPTSVKETEPATAPVAAKLAAAPEKSEAVALPADTAQVTVLIDGRQRSFRMPMHGPTVLEAAEAAGLDLPFSCRAAVCSTCRTRVTKGSAQMQENCALEPWEVDEGYILACQARPTTPELALDYDDK